MIGQLRLIKYIVPLAIPESKYLNPFKSIQSIPIFTFWTNSILCILVSVATLNPFDLLNEDFVKKSAIVEAPKKVSEKKVPTTTSTPSKAATTSKANNTPTTKNSNVELNASIQEKTPLRKSSAAPRSSNSSGNERQERRRTDRHSRTGYKQDGEKRLSGGKGSWGKAVEGAEQHVSVSESVAIAEGSTVESPESNEQEEQEEKIPSVPQLTLAQYQATVKKAALPSAVPRKIVASSNASTQQILKKETDVFVFPEIVKKSNTTEKKTPVVAAKKNAVDVSKFISLKAVSSLEEAPRAPRSSDRQSNDRRGNDRNSKRSSTPSNNNNNNTTPKTATSSKLNLKDDRAFPSLGSK